MNGMNGAIMKRWIKSRKLDETVAQNDSSLSSLSPTALQRYALGVLSAVVALLLRAIVSPWYGSANPYHTVWVAVVFSAWYCGLGPAILTVLVSMLGVWYFFVPQPFSFHSDHPQADIVGLIGFLILSGLIIAIAEANRRSNLKRGLAEEELQRAHHELEQRIQRRTNELEEKTAELLQKATLLDLANDAILVRDAGGRISYWNEGAERLYGWKSAEALGRVTSELLRTEFPLPLTEILQSDRWEGELRQYKRDGSLIIVASRWTTLRHSEGEPTEWLEINTNISARKAAEQAARHLSGRILTLQDEERRRIARDLHDSLGQYLTALKINLHNLLAGNGDQAALREECMSILEQCLAETRTISHLLHPPLLDEAGLRSALQWCVDGFSQRSGIEVSLDIPSKLRRFHREVEITLFRAVQEGLTNIHRHSQASRANIGLTVDAEKIQLEIEDNGTGIPKERLRSMAEPGTDTGVGLAGMRERVRDLGGLLTIRSDSSGTSLKVSIPILDSAQKAERKDQSLKRVSAP
jgi:PAS domain S-box-containing protein